ncbi:MAG: hypothetical protein ABI678_32925, partial [Kofleriaceae bacterium]
MKVLALLLVGCLEPRVADTRAPSGDIVAPGTSIPSIDEDGEDAETIAANDNVTGTVPRLSAFAAGAPVHGWDFGPAPSFAAPIYLVMRRLSSGELERVEHPPIVGTIPGEAGYSPFWSEFAVVVTDTYAGELITSSTAIEEAVRDGLVHAPEQLGVALDGPIVASDVRLEVGGAAVAAPTLVYYEHHTVAYFDFGEMPVTRAVEVRSAPRYVLRREGQEPLSEPIRGVDIDGDGDTVDSNDVYERAPTDPGRSPLCERIDVVVAAGTGSIDTSGNDTTADLTSMVQLFTPGPVIGTVI